MSRAWPFFGDYVKNVWDCAFPTIVRKSFFPAVCLRFRGSLKTELQLYCVVQHLPCRTKFVNVFWIINFVLGEDITWQICTGTWLFLFYFPMLEIQSCIWNVLKSCSPFFICPCFDLHSVIPTPQITLKLPYQAQSVSSVYFSTVNKVFQSPSIP